MDFYVVRIYIYFLYLDYAMTRRRRIFKMELLEDRGTLVKRMVMILPT